MNCYDFSICVGGGLDYCSIMKRMLDGMEKKKVIEMYIDLYSKFNKMCGLNWLSVDVLNVVLRYVRPDELMVFFLKNKLDYDMTFIFDAYEGEWDADFLKLFDVFSGMKLVGATVTSKLPIVFDRLYKLNRLRVICGNDNDNDDNKCCLRNVDFEKFFNLKSFEIRCWHARNLNKLIKCKKLCNVEIDVRQIIDINFLKNIVGLKRCTIFGRSYGMNMLTECMSLREIVLVKCDVGVNLNVLSECSVEKLTLTFCDWYGKREKTQVLRCKKLRHLILVASGMNWILPGIADLRECRVLERLKIVGGDSEFMNMMKLGAKLKRIDLYDNGLINLMFLKECNRLCYFSAYECSELEDIRGLEECGALRKVVLGKCRKLSLESVGSVRIRPGCKKIYGV